MQKIVPFLFFKDEAEEAVRFYTSIFKSSKIVKTVRYGDAGPGPKGDVMLVAFQLEGQDFYALNGRPAAVNFNMSISLFVNCKTQAEVDDLWKKLTIGGAEVQCGWLTDKFGISWQIVPTVLPELIGSDDPVKSQRAMKAMMKMVKIDIKGVQDAYDGR